MGCANIISVTQSGTAWRELGAVSLPALCQNRSAFKVVRQLIEEILEEFFAIAEPRRKLPQKRPRD